MVFSNEDTLKLMSVLFDLIQDEIHPEVSAARLAALTAILKCPGVQQSDLQDPVVKMSQQGASRAVLALQGRARSTDSYPVLIKSSPDPSFTRRNLLYPTPLAQDLLEQITKRLNKSFFGV